MQKSFKILYIFISILLISCSKNDKITDKKDDSIKKQDKFNKENTKEFDTNWSKINIKDVGFIYISPELEIQSGSYKDLSDENYTKATGSFDKNRVIIQQKGLNQSDKEAMKTYVRIIISTDYGKSNDYLKLDEQVNMKLKDVLEIDKEMEQGMIKTLKNINIKLLEWNTMVFTNLNFQNCTKISYKRQLKKEPPVIVNQYLFQNYDRMHKLTVSFREEEKDKWEKLLNETINTFKITNKIE